MGTSTNHLIQSVNMMTGLPPMVHPSALKHFRLNPTETTIYRVKYWQLKDQKLWMAHVPSAHRGMEKLVCSGDDEIMRLIARGVLVPDIKSDEEYAVQHAVGAADHRVYMLHPEIAKHYQFSYGVTVALMHIEGIRGIGSHAFFPEHGSFTSRVLHYTLVIAPFQSTTIQDYRGNILHNPHNTVYNVETSTFDELRTRGTLVKHKKGGGYKINGKYWNFRL